MMNIGFGGFDAIFNVFPIIFFLMFGLIFGLIVAGGIRSFRTWNRNNHSPRLTVAAQVINKRTQVGHHHHRGTSDHYHSHSYTNYFVTFEVDSGDRMELEVPGQESGLMVEGDKGLLTFQGTRFLGFERKV